MPWKCFAIKSIRRDLTPGGGSELLYTLPGGEEVKLDRLPIGAMFNADQVPPYSNGHPVFSPEHSFVVLLPGRVFWQMHGLPSRPPHNPWKVEGEIPNVTATPSIDFTGIYHGFVTNGEITDDVSGRKYDEIGRLINA